MIERLIHRIRVRIGLGGVALGSIMLLGLVAAPALAGAASKASSGSVRVTTIETEPASIVNPAGSTEGVPQDIVWPGDATSLAIPQKAGQALDVAVEMATTYSGDGMGCDLHVNLWGNLGDTPYGGFRLHLQQFGVQGGPGKEFVDSKTIPAPATSRIIYVSGLAETAFGEPCANYQEFTYWLRLSVVEMPQ